MARLYVIGAGGHAKVVIATAEACGFADIEIVDDAAERYPHGVLGRPVRGGVAGVLADPTATAVLAIGNNETRRKLATGALCRFAVLIHPSAVVHKSVRLGAGTVVFAGVVLQPDTRIGAHCIVNTSASIDHDCVLGDYVHVAPGTRLAGNVTLDAGVFLGIGAVCVPGVRIGAWTTVGAGAAVVGDLAAGVVAIGVPAKARVDGHPYR